MIYGAKAMWPKLHFHYNNITINIDYRLKYTTKTENSQCLTNLKKKNRDITWS